MYVKIVSHDASKSQSSSNIMQYLEKENEKKKLENEHLILEGKEDEINPNSVEYFFNQDYNPNDLEDPNSKINVYEAAAKLDGNRGTQNLSSSNFYMLNISPSQKELEHMETIAVEELKKRGLVLEKIEKDPTALEFYNEQKDQVMKIQMKLYTQDLMEEYARLMDREIYANQEALPTDAERKDLKPIIEERYNLFLKEKGIKLGEEKKEPDFTQLDNFKVKQEYPHGKIFTFYSSDINKNVDLFVPENKFKIENDKLLINEEYYSDKYNTIIDKEKEKREQVEITGTGKVSSEYFTDFIKEDKVCITEKWESFDKELKLYFNKDEFEVINGACHIPEKVYNDKLYEVKSQILGKEFADIKQQKLEDVLKAKNFDISKGFTQEGKEFYLYPDKVPSKDELKKLNIKASVDFNNYLVQEGYLPERKGFKISNWNDRTSIQAEVIAESDKAVLLLIDDERLQEPVQIWAGKTTVVDKESGELMTDENGKIQMISDFYEHKIQEILERENGNKLEFSDFQELESQREKFIKNTESIQFSLDNPGLKNPVTFNVQYEDVLLSPDGNYTMEKALLEHKLEKHIIRQAEKEFPKEFESIKEGVNKEMLEAKDFQKNKEIEVRFKNFLVDKNVLQENSKTENYFVQASVVEAKNNSTQIAFKPENSPEEVRLWVNNRMISKSDEKGIYFKNEKDINKLLDKAIERDKEKKQLVKIDFLKVETEEKKHKEESYKNYVFYAEAPGLSEPIKFSIKEGDLKQDGDQFLIEKHKLDFKLENAIKSGITKEFGNVKDDIKNEVWKENGFDTTKRKITGKDLMYYAKIETERKYDHKNKAVIKNKPILTKIKQYEQSKNPLDKLKIGDLKKQLLRDKYTGEIIDEGVKKGGLNYHSHIVVSRHDKTSLNPKDKVSMSPNANHKDGQNNNGAKIGFNRDEFSQNVEKIFDQKFEYNRPEKEKYQYLNQQKKSLSEKLGTRAKGMLKGELKKEVMKHTGMAIVKNELNPIQKIKGELMPLPIPTSFPKSKIDLVIKAIKMVKNLVVDKGIHY